MWNNVDRSTAEKTGGPGERHSDYRVGQHLDAEIAGIQVQYHAVGLPIHSCRGCVKHGRENTQTSCNNCSVRCHKKGRLHRGIVSWGCCYNYVLPGKAGSLFVLTPK
jgi:hypothetical protein